MSADHPRKDPSGLATETILLWAAIILVVSIVGSLYVTIHLGHRLAGTGIDVPSDPFSLVFELARGTVPWPGAWGWGVLTGVVFVIISLGILGGWLTHRIRYGKTRVDRAAGRLGRGRDIEGIRTKDVTAKAERLGITASPGVLIGKSVSTGAMLYGSWEDMHIDIWGPRTGKTTSRAVPAILDAPGAVVVTSNKRDVVDATRDPRADKGPVWVFDPQGIAL